MSALLEIKGLYGGYEKDVNILQGIDLTVDEGDAVGIIGLNGSGKSTLGKAVMNLIPYRRGSIVFNGQHIENKSTHELAQMGITMMYQGGVVFPNLSVWQNLSLSWGFKSDNAYYEQMENIIPLLRKPKQVLMRTMADKLSGGQRHELALAISLARKPKLLILDEPSAGLSPKAVEEMYGILRMIWEFMGLTIVLVEQNVAHAVAFCNRCVLIGQGRILDEFSCERLVLSEVESLMFKK